MGTSFYPPTPAGDPGDLDITSLSAGDLWALAEVEQELYPVRLAGLPLFVLEEVRDACPKVHQRRALAQLITLRLVADRRSR